MIKRSGQERYNAKTTAALVAMMMVCIIEIFFYTWCSVQCRCLKYEIGRQERIAAGFDAEQKELRIKLAGLKSPARIIGIARDQLGMVFPATDQIIIIP